MANAISKDQLKRLQIVYSQLARKTIMMSTDRQSRLDWATQQLARPVTSFSDLTREEARQLIDLCQGQLGVKAPAKRPLRLEQARRAALDGRHDGKEYAKTPQLAQAADIELIESFYRRLGWTRDRFDAWMRSPRSPLGRRSNPQIRTLAEANKVRWALKGMLVHAGLWTKEANRAAG